MRAHTLLHRSTAVLIVTALVAAVYSISMAQGVLPENKWQAVNPLLLPADIVGTGVKIKVGQSYKFVDYGVAEQAKLGVQYIWRPREANAKRVLMIYDMNSFSAKDWITLDKATPPDKTPPLAALLMAVDDGAYIGTPIKWNLQMGEAMRAAVSLEQRHPAIMASNALTIFANDVLARAAHIQVIQLLQGNVSGPNWDQMLFDFKRAGIKYDAVQMGWTPDELQLINAGNPAPMMAKQPKNPVYIAIDREIDGLSVEPLGRVVSVSGLGGERLGYKHSAWPTENSN